MHEDSAASLSSRRLFAWILLFTILGLGVRLALQQREWTLATDSFQYLLIADSLASGDGFASGGGQHPDVTRAPLFPLLVAGMAKLVGDVERAANLVAALTGALVVIPLALLAGELFGPRAAIAAAPLGALSCLVAASSRAMPTSPYVLACVGATWAAWRATKSPGLRASALAGGLAGLAALARAEGIVWPAALALWLVVATGGTSRSLRIKRVLTLLAVAGVVYLPYVVFASARLGRFSPTPGIEYVQDMRRVADQFKLRRGGRSNVPWAERARFIMTRDHRRLLLEDYFETRQFGEPDPAQLAAKPAQAGETAPRVSLQRIVRQRAWILFVNFRVIPRYLYWNHFLTPAVVGLGGLGILVAARRREHRGAVAFVAFVCLISLAPAYSHLEPRFFYPVFALSLSICAAGWAALAEVGGSTRRGRWIPLVVYTVLIAVVAREGWRHRTGAPTEPARERPLKEMAARVRDALPPGRMLAVQPAFPYLAGRPYRALPLGSPDEVLEFARANEACSLVLEGARDLVRRPELEALLSGPPPAGFQLVASAEHPEGRSLRVFALDGDGTHPCPRPSTNAIVPSGGADGHVVR